MKERPILFNAPMVRAILEGRKTQTRRIIKLNAAGRVQKSGRQWHIADDEAIIACPFGQPGDRLWVRETWRPSIAGGFVIYKTDSGRDASTQSLAKNDPSIKWKPSIFMPRWASRITLEITGVRVERLQDITEGDIFREGIQRLENHSWHATGSIPLGTYSGLDEWTDKVTYWVSPRDAYKALWKSIHGDGPWEKNPWVWVVEFKRVED